ncbi:MAG TPA: hypothetical protein VI547_13715 [Anaerolineales bacterium]|nr:hypothetical protein [Anaerolineales bacterium]
MTEPQRPQPDAPRVDSTTGLPLPDPYPEYVQCPHCGEMEVEVYCFETMAQCHNCGQAFEHKPPLRCGIFPFCRRGRTDRDAAGNEQSTVNGE